MYDVVNTLAPSVLIGSSSFLQVMRTTISEEFKIWPDRTKDCRDSCPRASEKSMYNVVNTSFLIGSSSFLQVTRTTIISRTSSKFGQIGSRTVELAALEHLEKSP